jgi:hypothetical protein
METTDAAPERVLPRKAAPRLPARADLHMPEQLGFGCGICFAGYVLPQIPSHVMNEYFR